MGYGLSLCQELGIPQNSPFKKGYFCDGFFLWCETILDRRIHLFRWVSHLKNVNLTIQNYFSPQKKKKLTTEFSFKNISKYYFKIGFFNQVAHVSHMFPMNSPCFDLFSY